MCVCAIAKTFLPAVLQIAADLKLSLYLSFLKTSIAVLALEIFHFAIVVVLTT